MFHAGSLTPKTAHIGVSSQNKLSIGNGTGPGSHGGKIKRIEADGTIVYYKAGELQEKQREEKQAQEQKEKGNEKKEIGQTISGKKIYGKEGEDPVGRSYEDHSDAAQAEQAMATYLEAKAAGEASQGRGARAEQLREQASYFKHASGHHTAKKEGQGLHGIESDRQRAMKGKLHKNEDTKKALRSLDNLCTGAAMFTSGDRSQLVSAFIPKGFFKSIKAVPKLALPPVEEVIPEFDFAKGYAEANTQLVKNINTNYDKLYKAQDYTGRSDMRKSVVGDTLDTIQGLLNRIPQREPTPVDSAPRRITSLGGHLVNVVETERRRKKSPLSTSGASADRSTNSDNSDNPVDLGTTYIRASSPRTSTSRRSRRQSSTGDISTDVRSGSVLGGLPSRPLFQGSSQGAGKDKKSDVRSGSVLGGLPSRPLFQGSSPGAVKDKKLPEIPSVDERPERPVVFENPRGGGRAISPGPRTSLIHSGKFGTPKPVAPGPPREMGGFSGRPPSTATKDLSRSITPAIGMLKSIPIDQNFDPYYTRSVPTSTLKSFAPEAQKSYPKAYADPSMYFISSRRNDTQWDHPYMVTPLQINKSEVRVMVPRPEI